MTWGTWKCEIKIGRNEHKREREDIKQLKPGGKIKL
jgi:hypothetical protein